MGSHEPFEYPWLTGYPWSLKVRLGNHGCSRYQRVCPVPMVSFEYFRVVRLACGSSGYSWVHHVPHMSLAPTVSGIIVCTCQYGRTHRTLLYSQLLQITHFRPFISSQPRSGLPPISQQLRHSLCLADAHAVSYFIHAVGNPRSLLHGREARISRDQ